MSSTKNISNAVVDVTFQKVKGSWVYRWATDDAGVDRVINLSMRNNIQIDLNIQNIFPDGEYSVNLWVKSKGRQIKYFVARNAYTVRVMRGGSEADFWKPNSNYKIEGL